MRLGSFWGLPAPAIVILFDEKRELLYKSLMRLNTDNNIKLLRDVRKEFSVLLQIASSCSYQLPDYEKVSTQYNDMKMVNHGVLEGAGELFTSSLVHEIVFGAVADIIKKEAKGKYYKVDKLNDLAVDLVKNETFPIGKINRMVSKLVKSLPESSVSAIPELVQKYGLREIAPEMVWLNGEKIRLTEDEVKIWEYFHQREDFIKEILERCVNGCAVEETTFGIPFFDLTKRKPTSLRYKIIDIFERAKDYRNSHLVVKCKTECATEIAKFKKCMDKYILQGEDNFSTLTGQQFDDTVAGYGEDCQDFFTGLVCRHELRYQDIQKDDLDMLCQIYSLIGERQDWDSILGVKSSAEVARHMRICGLNDFSYELFHEALIGTSLSFRGKITKSQEYLDEINEIVADVDALIETLIPVGEVI